MNRSLHGLMALAAVCVPFSMMQAQPLKGAIFTTTPDGGIVNENTHYEQKIEVYLDGGPGPNAPASAASLPAGDYVFQITDPPGKVLLSDDPSKCRIIEVSDDGVIVAWVNPSRYGLTDTYVVGRGGRSKTLDCQIDDAPDGAAGTSARHDTNIDTDHGELGAIVVQMMPFFNTPNPGGVYKAWITPIDTYIDRGGNLDMVPTPKKVKGKLVGYNNDPGYGPPRSIQKTDNFKVKEQPPMLHIHKFEDKDGDGILDPDERGVDGMGLSGWMMRVYEIHDGVRHEFNTCYTPHCWITVPFNTTIEVEEVFPKGECWRQSFVLIDHSPVAVANPVRVIYGPSDTEHTVEFGNWECAQKSGYKFKDHNMDGHWDKSDEPGLAGWEINLDGKAGDGASVHLSTTTNADGYYKFDELPPGSYIVSEICPDFGYWFQSFPYVSGYVCGDGVHDITLYSGDNDRYNNFGNFQKKKECVGHTPGFWKNWRNHYSYKQIKGLLNGTIAEGDIKKADMILDWNSCSIDRGLQCMTKFLLATELTLNLTGSDYPKANTADLTEQCRISGYNPGDLGFWLARARDIYSVKGVGYSTGEILETKTVLDIFANLGGD